MADNRLLDPAMAAATNASRCGTPRQRIGNWLTKEQANELLNAPDLRRVKGKRDRAILERKEIMAD